MKKLFTLLTTVTLSVMLFAQAPQSFSYQTVIRDASWTVLDNQSVGIKIAVLEDAANGNVVYEESHSAITSQIGLVNLSVGEGAVISGVFSTIDWGNHNYFIEVAVDINGGSNYIVMGSTQLRSVPYALYAENSGTAGPQGPIGLTGPAGANGIDGANGVDGVDGAVGAQGPIGLTGSQGIQGVPGNDGQDGNDGAQGIAGVDGVDGTNGATGIQGDSGVAGIQGLTGAQGNPATDDQCLTVSQTGDTLHISGCNTYVIINGISNTNYPSSPEADFSSNLIIITEGESVVFFDNSTNNPTSWTWDFGDSNTSTDQNPTHIYLAAGTYSVSLTATNSYGSDIYTQNDLIIVNDASIAQFADFSATPTSISSGYVVNFTDLSTNYPTTWTWDFGDGNSSSLQNPTNTYNSSGIYSVMLVADNDTTVKDNYIYVSGVASIPVADFIADDTVKLENEMIQFSDLSINNPVIWSWNFGDGNTSALQNPTHNYIATGDYTVSLTATNMYGGNAIVKTNYMHIGLVPIATFSADDQSILANDTVSFTDISANAPTSWFWDFGDGNTSTVQHPIHIYTVGGSYDVTLIATNMFGSDTLLSQSFINVFLPPVAAFYASQTTVAGGVIIQFTDQSLNNPTTWLWDFGDGNTSTVQNPTHFYINAGVYSVSLNVTSGFGADYYYLIDYITIQTNALQIGDFHEGGVVFWIDSSNIHGLICDIQNLNSNAHAEWGCYQTFISGAVGTAIGTGQQNTIDIVNANCTPVSSGYPIAANLCANSTAQGYSDWFLASKYEMYEMYQNQAAINTTSQANGGSAILLDNYWTSTEYNWAISVVLHFINGNLHHQSKNGHFYVRAIRAF